MRRLGLRDGIRGGTRGGGRGGGNGGGNQGGSGGGGGTPPPAFTSSATANVAENATLSHTLTATRNPTFSIVGGADQARFEISGSTLQWLSNGTKDFEAPNDADTNNTYIVTVRATKGSQTTDQTITVTVTDAVTPVVFYAGGGPSGTGSDSATVDVGASGLVVMVVFWSRNSGTGNHITAASINGRTLGAGASIITESGTGGIKGCGIVACTVPDSGTITCSATVSGGTAPTVAVGVWNLRGLSSTTPYASNSTQAITTQISMTVGTPADGVLIGGAARTTGSTVSGYDAHDVSNVALGAFGFIWGSHKGPTILEAAHSITTDTTANVHHSLTAASWV